MEQSPLFDQFYSRLCLGLKSWEEKPTDSLLSEELPSLKNDLFAQDTPKT